MMDSESRLAPWLPKMDAATTAGMVSASYRRSSVIRSFCTQLARLLNSPLWVADWKR